VRYRAVVLSGLIAFAVINGHAQSASTAPSQTEDGIAEHTTAPNPPVAEEHSKHHKGSKSAGAEVGSGVGDIGKGAAKGAGDLAKGTGKGVVDLATLHPIDAATDIGKGAGKAGGHVAVGAVKGTGKVVKGTAKAIKHVF
jgi:hypothetical protein